jgi:hypothetical protein
LLEFFIKLAPDLSAVETHGADARHRRPGEQTGVARDSLQHSHPAHPAVTTETHALVQTFRGLMAGIHFEVERDTATIARDLQRRLHELAADAAATPARLDLYLVEPRRVTAVLQRPQK